MKLHSVAFFRPLKNQSKTRLTWKTATPLMTIMFVMALSISLIPTGKASASSQLGLYTGLAKVADHDSFSSWLNNPVPYTTDYVDYRTGWANDFNPYWLIGPWSTWVKASPGRRLVLGLPMLENSNAGQFDQGTAGAFDSYFLSLGNNLVSNGLGGSIIKLGYEANFPGIGPWQATNNPGGYVRDFRHIVGLLRSIPGSSFVIDWTTAAGVQPNSLTNSFDSFYPGDDVVDIIGMDVYDMKWNDTTSTPSQRWQFLQTQAMGLNDHKAYAATHNKPMSFPEWGLYKSGDQYGGGGDDPYYIDQMANWFASSNTYYQSYFNINWGGGVLSDFPNGNAEYKTRFGQVAVAADTTAPAVSLTQPTNGSTVSGTTPVSANATDNVAVSKVEFYVDGTIATTTSASPYSFNWNTAAVANGSHTLFASAYDAAGNKTVSAVATVIVSNATTVNVDSIAPTVNISAPLNNTVIGSSVTINASATDNQAVTKMEVYVDGSRQRTFYSSSLSYGTRIKQSGSHTITVKAYDAASNIGQTSVVVIR